MRSLVSISLLLVAVGAVAGQSLPGTPELRLLFAFGSEGDQPGQFRNPMGIAVDLEGNVYVADTGNNRIQKFDGNGRFLKQIGGFGWGREQFDRPVDICASAGLDVFVADYNNERIERYDSHLNYISSYYPDESQDETLRFGFPLSVALSRHGELFLVDGENRRLLKINSFGVPELSFGDFRWAQGRLERPAQVALSAKDLVYVVDAGGGCVLVYDYSGNFIRKLGAELLRAPTGVSVDSHGCIWVADTGNDRILAFSPEGRLLGQWGAHGDKLGAFKRPTDVAIGAGRVYVLDGGNCRVQVFELSGQ
ncbi:MAG: NHL repeat-containing protein [Calditrichaeota bacterium]|nr:NHL repeat-containing protein [Calditrichota bacterium]